MSWSIITDSSCDLICEDLPDNIHYERVPFTISVGSKDYVDVETLNTVEMIEDMESFSGASHTSCPAPGAWYELFEKSEQTIVITISKKLSGSYNSAFAAKGMILEKYPEKKIFILDSESAGSALALLVEKAVEMIEKGFDFEAVTTEMQQYSNKLNTIFALSSFRNLVKNGRMSRLSGFIAGKLGIWGIGIAEEGKITVKSKTRGLNRVISEFINDMKENNFVKGKVIISHCQNYTLAEDLKNSILESWSAADVRILATGGLCSYYAERGGLIVAY